MRTVFQKTIALFAIIVLSYNGCTDSTTTGPEPAALGTISMTSFYDASVQTQPEKFVSVNAVDSIKITRARLVLRDIKFKTEVEEIANFKTEPIVLELSLFGFLQDVAVENVPYGPYRKIEFDIHRVDPSDTLNLPLPEREKFRDFAQAERYSIIINGIVYKSGNAVNFVYKSRINEKQKMTFDKELLITPENKTANVTLKLNSFGWFRTTNGTLLDPTDNGNSAEIDNNLKASIKVFKDDDKDGIKD